MASKKDTGHDLVSFYLYSIFERHVVRGISHIVNGFDNRIIFYLYLQSSLSVCVRLSRVKMIGGVDFGSVYHFF